MKALKLKSSSDEEPMYAMFVKDQYGMIDNIIPTEIPDLLHADHSIDSIKDICYSYTKKNLKNYELVDIEIKIKR